MYADSHRKFVPTNLKTSVIGRPPLPPPLPHPPIMQSLEPSEEDQLLIVNGEDEEALKETCPEEFLDLQEKDVRALI